MSEVHNKVCEDCPLSSSIDVAYKLLEETPDFHKRVSDRAAAMGNLTLRASILLRVAGEVKCDGPVRDSDQSITCPLKDTVNDAQNHMGGPMEQAKMLFAYELFYEEETEEQLDSGQYL